MTAPTDRTPATEPTDTSAARIPPSMLVASYRRFGAPEVIEPAIVPTPDPAPGQVLIEVGAASLNPYDWHFVRALPYIVRFQAGFRRPKRPIVGVDVAGTVVAIGDGVTAHAVGDRVFGGATGSCAQYAVANARSVVAMPANASFAEAAGIPMAGYTALQAVRDTAAVGSGDRVLVNGASGGVGLMAVQIAKAFGAEVTAVCSGRNEELVRDAGADHVVDYTRNDFLETDERYDAVIDMVMTKPLRAVAGVMAEDGRYALVGALEIGDWFGPIAMWAKPFMASIGRSQRFGVTMAAADAADLEALSSMFEAGEIRTFIDRTYPLSKTGMALAHVETGHARGKVIVDVLGG